jgi:hypothetical protein
VLVIIVFGNIEVNAWWEWFVTTILGVGTTGFIAVANRSHNIFKRCFGTKKKSLFDQSGRCAANGPADT